MRRLGLALAVLLVGAAAGVLIATTVSTDRAPTTFVPIAPQVTTPTDPALQSALEGCNETIPGDCEGLELRQLAIADPAAALDRYYEMANEDPSLRNLCHSMLHNVGFGAALGERTTWEAFMAGSSECNWGYAHGVVQAALWVPYDQIMQTAVAVCAVPEGLDETDRFVVNSMENCIHGVGHAIVRTGVEPEVAIAGCYEAFDRGEHQASCINGLTMEYSQSEKVKTGELDGLCTLMPEQVKARCYANIGPTWLQGNEYDFDDAYARCAEAAPVSEYLERCGESIGGVHVIILSFDFDEMLRACAQLPEHVSTGCYTGVVINGRHGVNAVATTQEEFDSFKERIPPEHRTRVDELIGTYSDEIGQISGVDPTVER